MFSNYPMNQQVGTQVINRPVPKSTQPLTAEEINQLRAKTTKIDWQVTMEDVLKSKCTHKDKNGASTLINNPDGTSHCTICGADFSIFDGTPEDVQKAVNTIESILQTIKTIYFDCPENFVSTYFQFIPLLHKLPILWGEAAKTFERYEYSNSYGTIPTNGYTTNSWGLLQQITSPMGNMIPGMPIGQQGMPPVPYQMPYNPMAQMQAQQQSMPQMNQMAQAANTYMQPPMGQQVPSPFVMQNQAVPQQQVAQTQTQPTVQPQENPEIVQTQAFSV